MKGANVTVPPVFVEDTVTEAEYLCQKVQEEMEELFGWGSVSGNQPLARTPGGNEHERVQSLIGGETAASCAKL